MPHLAQLARFGVAAALLLPAAGCSSRPPPVTTTPPARPVSQLAPADRDFLDAALQSGLAEVAAGRLAAARGTAPQVRQFGQQMVDRHGAINQQLASLAQSNGMTPPTGPSPAGREMLARLQGLRGAAFDHAYLLGQIDAHKQALALYENEAAQGVDPDVTALAAQTAPVIRDHLRVATALQGVAR
jgi:putative membrane protein